MAGIVSFGGYVPRMRLGPATKNYPGKSVRAVANFDEDAITLGVAAGANCLRSVGGPRVDALFFASTSAPYVEKQAATVAATALDLPSDLFAVDFAHSTRAATQAIRLAADSVSAGSQDHVLVVASEVRPAAPGSDIEREAGDGAAAVIIGRDSPIAEITAAYSVSRDVMDVWRADGDTHVRAADDEHFRHGKGYLNAMTACKDGLEQRFGIGIADFDRVILYAPDARRHAEAARQLGIDAEQLQPLPEGLGNSGATYALLQLVLLLETAEPGTRILVLNYGDGAEALALTVTPAIVGYRASFHRPTGGYQHRGRPVADYHDYLTWRDPDQRWLATPELTPPSPFALLRDQSKNIRFRGMRCAKCDVVQWPPQRVCAKCHAKDQAEPVRLADNPGRLFTYSLDYVAKSPETPLVLGVVDFDAGARAMLMVTERDLDDVHIGMPLEMTFRKFYTAGGISNYLWKATPNPNAH